MDYQTITMTRSERITKIALNRPDKLNSFNVQMHEELSAALDQAASDRGTRAVILTGQGRGFCAGQDLSDRVRQPGAPPVDLGDSIERYYGPLVRKIATLPKPVICGVNGVAAGAGVSIALAADIVVAARSARFILSFVKIGLIPDSGATWILPRLVGQARATGIAMSGDPISAAQAEAWGMIWKCADDETFDDELKSTAARIAERAPRALIETRRLMRGSGQSSFSEQLDRERDVMRELGFANDYREGVAAFREKRKPEFDEYPSNGDSATAHPNIDELGQET